MQRNILCALFGLMLGATLPASASVELGEVRGWFESGYVTWSPVAGASSYNVYVRAEGDGTWQQLDRELVRQYPTCLRADAVGLAAGSYQFRVVPVDAEGEMSGEASESAAFTVTAHDRSGFAHVGMDDGIGAYRNDGTLREGAKVIYVWGDNARTVSTTVRTSSSKTTTAAGLQDILSLYQKGYDTTPLAIRVIGTIRAADMDRFDSSSEGLQIKGKNAYSPMPITLEGIGDDATLHGFGLLLRNCHGTEVRNLGVMWCMDDALSLDTGNSNVWVHNNDFFYGQPGSDSDQAKGDGTVDIKGQSTHITVSYNHFIDNGKSSLGGMKSETTSCWHTYHHNWFDHSDSRHPRIRTMFFHVYNNYFDGVSKYGVGVTMGGSALVEGNCFRNCKYPMLSSRQGTDAEGSGTFSGEDGGVIKAFGNQIINPRKVQYYTESQTGGRWDAVLATSRNDEVSAVAFTGGTPYNNEADLAARTTYVENRLDAAPDVPGIVRGELGAGRMNHGDFRWTFRNASQDENYDVIADLRNALRDYSSTLVGFADGTAIRNGGASATVDGGDGKGLDPADNDAYVPSWAGGGEQPGPSADSEAYLVTDLGDGTYDYFWLTADNAAAVQACLLSGILTLDADSKFQTDNAVTGNDGTVYSDLVGSLQLAKGTGSLTVYCPQGLTEVDYYLVRTGSFKCVVEVSDDGENFSEYTNFGGNKGVLRFNLTLSESHPYVRLVNTATGSLHVQGLMAMRQKGTESISKVRNDLRPASSGGYDLLGRPVQTPRQKLLIQKGKKMYRK